MSHLSQCYVNVMSSCYVSSQSVLSECDAIMLCRISVYCHHVMSHLGVLPWEPLFKYENVVLKGEQKKKNHLCED